jgi:alpha-glucosidase (family GH31 glycosyl hydrolase)
VRSFEFNFQAPKSIVVGERSSDRVTFRAVYPSVAKYQDEQGELSVDIIAERIAGGFHFTAKPGWAKNVTVRLRDLDDHFFGLLEMLYPNNRPSPDLRGSVVDIDTFGNGSQYHENYASVWSAFYMTTRGYASFFDTFAKGRYRLGLNGETELYHHTGALDWYIFVGRNGDEILNAYYGVIGAPKAPPLWALGPIGWRDQNNGGAEEIIEDVRHMSELKIPFTAWFVDRPYSDGENAWSKMNFSAKFAKPEEWIGKLEKDYGLKFMTWIAPMTFGDASFPGLLAGEHGYMDLTDPAAIDEFEKRLKLQYAVGVHGHKNDRADELFPEMTTWKDGTPEAERRNKYLYLYAKVTHDMLTRAWGADQCNFARGAFHRTQPYLSAVWGGDSRSSWDGLAANLANAIRCGFMGFPVWGTDTGGYLGGRIDEELYARWLEWGAWNGLFEIKLDDAAGKNQDRPPWVYSDKLQMAFREACELRMQLLPYLNSLTQTAAKTGVLMKPLAYVWPADVATHMIWDEYLFGSAFLVAPITKLGGERSVYLPEGRWYDFYEPARQYEGEQTITVTTPFNHIPVFVRENTIYVTGTIPIGNRRQWESVKPSYIIQATPGRNGDRAEFELIDSLDQNKSKFLQVNVRGAAVRFSMPALGAPGELRVRQKPPTRVRVNGRLFDAKYDALLAVYRIPFSANAAFEVEVMPYDPTGGIQR